MPADIAFFALISIKLKSCISVGEYILDYIPSPSSPLRPEPQTYRL